MEYKPGDIAYIAILYHQMKVCEINLDATDRMGPNAVGIEANAKERLKILLDSYKQVPPEIRKHLEKLDSDISRLEEKLKEATG